MRTIFLLKLGLGSEFVPLRAVQHGDVAINSLAKQWACTYCTIASINSSILIMPFIKYTCPYKVSFIQGKVIEILDDGIEE